MNEKLIVTDVFQDEKMYHVETEEGMVFGLEKRFLNGVIPKVGDRVLLHLEYCSKIVGVDINDKEVYHLTEEQQEELHREQVEKFKEHHRALFEKDKEHLDKMFEVLPKLIQCRIEMYRKFVDNFRVEHEAYELSAMFLGYKLYKHCKADNYDDFTKRLDAFNIVKYIRTHKLLKTRGISSNQVQFAKVFACCIFKDEITNKIDLSSPTDDMLRTSAVMEVPNALCILGDVLCNPREEYIEKYIQER